MLMQSAKPLGELEDSHEFAARHIGVSEADQALMLQTVGAESRRVLMARIVPDSIARRSAMAIPAPLSELMPAAPRTKRKARELPTLLTAPLTSAVICTSSSGSSEPSD